MVCLLNDCNDQNEKEKLEKIYINGFSNFSIILNKLTPIKTEIKKKFLSLCLHLKNYKSTIVANLNENILNFMKNDYKLFLSIMEIHDDKLLFQNEFVNILKEKKKL